MLEKFKKYLNIKSDDIKEDGVSVENHIEELYLSSVSDVIVLKIGCDLQVFTEKIKENLGQLRDEIFDKNGFVLPLIKIAVDETIQENQYQIFVHHEMAYTGFSMFDANSAVDEIADSFRFLVSVKIEDLFSNQIVEKFIDLVQKNNSWLIWNLSNTLPIWGIKLILVNLLQDGKSIKNIVNIFEKISKYATKYQKVNGIADPYVVSRFVCEEMSPFD